MRSRSWNGRMYVVAVTRLSQAPSAVVVSARAAASQCRRRSARRPPAPWRRAACGRSTARGRRPPGTRARRRAPAGSRRRPRPFRRRRPLCFDAIGVVEHQPPRRRRCSAVLLVAPVGEVAATSAGAAIAKIERRRSVARQGPIRQACDPREFAHSVCYVAAQLHLGLDQLRESGPQVRPVTIQGMMSLSAWTAPARSAVGARFAGQDAGESAPRLRVRGIVAEAPPQEIHQIVAHEGPGRELVAGARMVEVALRGVGVRRLERETADPRRNDRATGSRAGPGVEACRKIGAFRRPALETRSSRAWRIEVASEWL